MAESRMTLNDIVTALRKHHGRARFPASPNVRDPFQIILYENAAYLVDDERRADVWSALKHQIGLTPLEIAKASPKRIANVIKNGGMQPTRRAEKLREAARITLEQFDGNLATVLSLPLPRARRALKQFPGMGEPGVDKVLLLTRTQPILALDSNGLRTLRRLGYGTASKNYAAEYRSVQKQLADQTGDGCGFLIEAHHLLRKHGQTVCRREMPECDLCPLRARCVFAKSIRLSRMDRAEPPTHARPAMRRPPDKRNHRAG